METCVSWVLGRENKTDPQLVLLFFNVYVESSFLYLLTLKVLGKFESKSRCTIQENLKIS